MESLNKGMIILIRDSIFDIAKEIKEDRKDLYNKLIDIYDEIDNLFVADDDIFAWPMTKNNFCDEFDIDRGTFNSHVQNLRLKERGEYWVDGACSGRTSIPYISKIGAIKILEKMRSRKAKKYLMNYHNMNIPTKSERKYLDIIQYAIYDFDISNKKKNVPKINNKKYAAIDLYLENSKLAIECDELDHTYKNSLEESSREEAIVKELGCRFLRFNPDELDFNIGEVVNVILCHILNKKINGEDPLEYYKKSKEKRTRVWGNKLNRTRKKIIKVDDDELI